MVRWVKDVDSGELFPVSDESEIEIPAHLQESEYTPIDYDKTTEMTVLQLQEQLFAAQEQIKIMTEKPKAEPIILEKKSETPVSAEYLEVDCEKVPKQHNLTNLIMGVIIGLILICFLGVSVLVLNKVLASAPVEPVQQVQQVEEVAEENEESDFALILKILPVAITVVGIKCAIQFMMKTIREC